MNDSHNKIRVAVATLGARRHYETPYLLNEAGYLERFFTDTYIGNKPWLEKLLLTLQVLVRSRGLARLLGRRCNLPRGKVVSFDWFGAWYVLAQRAGKKRGELEEVFCNAAIIFAEKIKKKGLTGCDAVIGCNGASAELFEYANSLGLYCILDQTSNPKPIEDQLTTEEHRHWKDWIPDSDDFLQKSLLKEREFREWELADKIIAGSLFVKEGLMKCGVPEKKITVIPSRIDYSKFREPHRSSFDGKRPLRVLFVGRVSVMKGVPYLLEALRLIESGRIEARLVGNISIVPKQIIAHSDIANFVGPVPRNQVSEHYEWADVFCFPSITEGSAGVTYEALAAGLPVITTPNAGSIVRDGIDGFIVPIRDAKSLAAALKRYLEKPELLKDHQENANSLSRGARVAPSETNLVRFMDNLTKKLRTED